LADEESERRLHLLADLLNQLAALTADVLKALGAVVEDKGEFAHAVREVLQQGFVSRVGEKTLEPAARKTMEFHHELDEKIRSLEKQFHELSSKIKENTRRLS
jgi:hypothetical protein